MYGHDDNTIILAFRKYVTVNITDGDVRKCRFPMIDKCEKLIDVRTVRTRKKQTRDLTKVYQIRLEIQI